MEQCKENNYKYIWCDQSALGCGKRAGKERLRQEACEGRGGVVKVEGEEGYESFPK